jgi:hypothetical protein
VIWIQTDRICSSKLAYHLFLIESKNLPGRPPLEISFCHSRQLLKLMANKEGVLAIFFTIYNLWFHDEQWLVFLIRENV